MKTFEHPLFLITALCLFFPIGLIFLLISEHTTKKKLLMATIGALVFTALLATVFFGIPEETPITNLDLTVTKEQLTVGQSGGFAVYSANRIITDFEAAPNNDCISINDNVFTATKVGSSVIKVQANGLETSFTVTITEGIATDSIVYLSPTGKRYHKTVSHSGINAIEMTEEEALRTGKTPCKICYK